MATTWSCSKGGAKAGGLNEYGIAAYKMTDDFAQREVDFLLGVGGIEIRLGIELGQDVQLGTLADEYDAVFVSVGMAGTNDLPVPGEDLDGVIDAVAFIEALRQAEDKGALPVGHDVVVIGGGNTAIDIATQVRRLGAVNVTIAYRRGLEQMGATGYEQEVAQTNGVAIKTFAAPVRMLGEAGKLVGVELERTRLDDRGGLAMTGERFTLAADQAFKAVGQRLMPGDLNGVSEVPALERGKIRVDEHRATSLRKVWAGGDATGLGQDLTVVAVEDGKIAARSIHDFLSGSVDLPGN